MISSATKQKAIFWTVTSFAVSTVPMKRRFASPHTQVWGYRSERSGEALSRQLSPVASSLCGDTTLRGFYRMCKTRRPLEPVAGPALAPDAG